MARPAPSARLAGAVRALRRAVLRRRRGLAALLAGVALLAGLSAVRGPASSTEPVRVAARDLPAGTLITASDLTNAAWAPGTVPSGLAPDAVGRVLAAPLRRGEPVTDVRLVGPSLTAGTPGEVAVPVRMPDAETAGLLRVGDRVDLVAADPQGGAAARLVDDVPVLAVPAPPPDAAASSSLPGRVVVVGLAPDDVAEVVQATVSAFVTYTWTSR